MNCLSSGSQSDADLQFSGGQDEAMSDVGLDEGSRYDEKTKQKPLCGTGEMLERQEEVQPTAGLIQNLGGKKKYQACEFGMSIRPNIGFG